MHIVKVRGLRAYSQNRLPRRKTEGGNRQITTLNPITIYRSVSIKTLGLKFLISHFNLALVHANEVIA
jgi:hypothetical protein